MSEQFFSVVHRLPINVEFLSELAPTPTLEELEQELPEAFRMAGAAQHIDLVQARQVRELGDEADILINVINQQASKINMLLTYLLSLQDDPARRFQTQSFGGSHLSFYCPMPLHQDQLLQLKLFLREQASAVYCYGRICAIEETTEGQLIHVSYVSIRPDDQEELVRASLQIQSRQLKQRAELRTNQPR